MFLYERSSILCISAINMQKPVHVKASEGDIAKLALICDDRDRVKDIAGLLDDCRLASDSRGYLVYTGKHNGTAVSVASHGIGGPSCAILVEELAMYGVREIVMFGTTGPLTESINLGDFVISTRSRHPPGGLYSGYGAQDDEKVPDSRLMARITRSFRESGLRFHEGGVYCSDTYYAEDRDFVKSMADQGNISVEMESATLFMLGRLRDIATAAVFIASNTVADKAYLHEADITERSRAGAKAIFDALCEK